MSRAVTISLIERFFASVNARDFDGVEDCMHEDMVFEFSPGKRDFGKRAFRQFLAEQTTGSDEQIGDITIITSEDGTRAAAEFTRRGRVPNAADDGLPGERFSRPDGMFFAVEDGLISRITGCGVLAQPH